MKPSTVELQIRREERLLQFDRPEIVPLNLQRQHLQPFSYYVPWSRERIIVLSPSYNLKLIPMKEPRYGGDSRARRRITIRLHFIIYTTARACRLVLSIEWKSAIFTSSGTLTSITHLIMESCPEQNDQTPMKVSCVHEEIRMWPQLAKREKLKLGVDFANRWLFRYPSRCSDIGEVWPRTRIFVILIRAPKSALIFGQLNTNTASGY